MNEKFDVDIKVPDKFGFNIHSVCNIVSTLEDCLQFAAKKKNRQKGPDPDSHDQSSQSLIKSTLNELSKDVSSLQSKVKQLSELQHEADKKRKWSTGEYDSVDEWFMNLSQNKKRHLKTVHDAMHKMADA